MSGEEVKPRAGLGSYGLEFSGVRLLGKFIAGVTAWIAMNSAHPPLSKLVIVLNLLPL